jgi:nicotinamide-nucleotide amidase
MNDRALTRLAARLGRACRKRKVLVASAESCTGGGVAEAITRIAGSSNWFDRGFVTYSNDAKVKLLGVSKRTLGKHGAVSEETAREMARGALRRSRGQASVAVTGIAGPGGGSRAKPVGLVWLAWAGRGVGVQTRVFRFRGGRAAVRRQSVAVALQGLLELVG